MYSKLAVVAAVLLVAVAGAAAEEYNCNAEGRVCQNGGVCHENALQTPESGSGNGWTTPFCVCQAPWGGPDCSRKIRECKDSPCQNGGTCSPADCRIGTNNQYYDCFTCSCPFGWTGAPSYAGGGGLCDWKLQVQDCSNNVCANGGTCTNVDLGSGSDLIHGYQCACTADWFGGQTGQAANRAWNCTVPRCTQTDGACLNGGTCTSGTCSCTGGYWGDRCEKAPFCAANPCMNGQTCVNLANGNGRCDSPPFCDSNPCPAGATCTPSGCQCLAPTDGTLSCNGTLFCNSSPCQNGGNCTNQANVSPQGGAGYCTCPKGFIGDFCEERIKGCGVNIGDELLGRPQGCAPNAAAPSQAPGPAGTDPINKCACFDKVSCDYSFFNTRCRCPASTGGLVFYDCRCNSTTTSKCPGTTGTVRGRNADMVCQNGGTCQESFEATGCRCRDGFWGDKCQNYDNPCLNNPCENGGRCGIVSETAGVPLDDRFWAYQCNCKWPYYGKNCERVAPVPTADGLKPVVCSATTCLNGGTCSANTYQTNPGGFFYSNPWTGTAQEGEPWTCACPDGFGGPQCEVVLERCTPSTCGMGHCKNDPSVGVRCSCPCGFAGDRCEVPATNAAAASLANFANDGSGGVGYMLEYCSRDENLCKNGGTCFHTQNGQGFGCGCTSGWSGTYCQNRVRSAATGVVPSLIAVAAAVAVAFALKH